MTYSGSSLGLFSQGNYISEQYTQVPLLANISGKSVC